MERVRRRRLDLPDPGRDTEQWQAAAPGRHRIGPPDLTFSPICRRTELRSFMTTPVEPEDSHDADTTVEIVELATADDAGLVATGAGRPLLAWRLSAEDPSFSQRGYEVQWAADDGFRTGVVSSGTVSSDRSHDIQMPGPPLLSREVRWWRVRVRTDRGWTGWSGPAHVEAALLEQGDWSARPIALGSDIGRRTAGPAPMFRREFRVPPNWRSARLYVTALGVHDTRLNGVAVSEDLLEPGWTSYGHRLLYSTYDVTRMLEPGANVISATVGDGWYRGTLTWESHRNVYGDATALIAQLEVVLDDGERLAVSTDDAWRASTGEIASAGLYEGSAIDLRNRQDGWQLPGFDDSAWAPVVTLDLPAGLEQRAMPAVRVIETRSPGLAARSQRIRVDAGQNLTGYVRITAAGMRGAKVVVRHAEVVDGNDELHTAALRGATSTDTYVLADERATVLSPAFTVHGFRYADITFDPGVTIGEVEVVVVASDLSVTGAFSCSEESVNRLFDNVLWSQRGNFLSLPTDCPQRDERLGWTGDIQVFAATACHIADSRSFLRNWLRDLAVEQRADGCVPNVVPDVLHLVDGSDFEFGSTGWADAAVIVPWALYEAYGDVDVLARHYDSMSRWVEWSRRQLDGDGIWSSGFHFGDWLDPGAPSERPYEATTPTPFVATSSFAHSARLLARVALLLGRDQDAERYAGIGDAAAGAAWARFADEALGTQTGCALALEFCIAPQEDRAKIGERLADLVRTSQGRISTGFLGTPLVLPALTAAGQHEQAYRLLLNDRCPGWLHQVRQGATTIWERWDALDESGTIHAGDLDDGASMMSFNHYAYGAVAAWLFRSVAGLAPDAEAPGYRRIVFAPVPGGGLTWAQAEMKTRYGVAAIRWELDTDRSLFIADVEVPGGASGLFILPPGTRESHRDGAEPTACGYGVHQGRTAMTLRAGRHRLVLDVRHE
ncbi:family 78 glycoside hydrolase catalytic domain [Streptomyces sp. NPDC020917]|uniref:family 78 glycoside hydrolase catalytic domain n=1 Tax=Streptomyces sp. NPDC020917 TaxID=3365102 RepID=UPI0037BA2512